MQIDCLERGIFIDRDADECIQQRGIVDRVDRDRECLLACAIVTGAGKVPVQATVGNSYRDDR